MADLTPRVVRSSDETRWDDTSRAAVHVVRVEYMLGQLGPFIVELARDTFSEYALDAAMAQRRAALQRFT